MWTDDPLFQPQPLAVTKLRKQTRRYNHEYIAVLARSISGRKYLAERLDYHDKQLVADDIASGQIYDAEAVFAFHPVDGYCHDISEEIAKLCLDKHGITRSNRDFLEDHLGVS
jgi:hypothetical protein